MSFQDLKISLLEELDENHIKILSQSINKSIESASNDFEEEYKTIFEKIVKENEIYEFHSLIIEWKSNFLKSQTSDFAILKRNSLRFSIKLNENKIVEISKMALTFYHLYKPFRGFNNVKKFIDDFSNEVYNFHKNEFFYKSSIDLIRIFNENVNNLFKLPKIEHFEVDSFKLLREINVKNKTNYEELQKLRQDIFDSKEKFLNEISEENKSRIRELRELNTDLISDKRKLESDITNLSESLKESEIYLTEIKKQNENIINYNNKREPVYVFQFDRTVWGDNYPALKILYNFLLEYYNISFNWSFFAYMMTIESKEIINLNLKIFNKTETGYLLFKIKDFFKYSISKDYFNWLSKKVTIKNDKTKSSYFNKYIQDTEYTLITNEKHKDLINDLCKRILNCYN